MSLLWRILLAVACVLAVCAVPQRNFAVQSRIAGAHSNAASGQFSFMGSIQTYSTLSLSFEKYHTCGGSIISDKWVVTAGHCLCNGYLNKIADALAAGLPIKPLTKLLSTLICTVTSPSRLFVVTGSIYLNPPGEEHAVDIVVQHPRFDASTLANDIGCIHMKTATDASTRLILSKVAPPYPDCTIMGWGLNNERDTSLPNTLQTASCNLLSNDACIQAIENANIKSYVTAANICTDSKDSSSCPGDSGSALISPTDTGSKGFGITSYGYVFDDTTFCRGGLPDVYTAIPAHCPFIFNTTTVQCE